MDDDTPTFSGGFGFIILCLEDLPSDVNITISRIRSLYPDSPIRLGMPLRLACDEMERYKKYKVPIDMGGSTITGLINLSVSKSKLDWNFILMAGASVTQNIIKKYLYFCRKNNDFMYPVVNRKWVFPEASINGMFYNRKFTPKAPENESEMALAKAIWGAEVMQSGGRLKAIIGAKF